MVQTSPAVPTEGAVMLRIAKKLTAIQDKFELGVLDGFVLAATSVRDSVVVYHGPRGCSMTLEHIRGDNCPDGCNVPIVSTSVEEGEVIHGDSGKMKAALRKGADVAQKRGLRFAWFVDNCATSMIADDMDGVAGSVAEEAGIPIIVADTPRFLGGPCRGGQMASALFLEQFASPTTKNGSLNLLGPHFMGSKSWPWDVREMLRLLQAAEVPVNTTLTFLNTVEDGEGFGRAQAAYPLFNEDVSPELAGQLDRLGVETWGSDLPLPIGITNTEEWYIALAERFGNVEKAKEQLHADMERVKSRLRGDYNASWVFHDISSKQVGIYGTAPFATALARSLYYDFNAVPRVVALIAETEGAFQRSLNLLADMGKYVDVEVLQNPTYFEYGNALKRASVDFAIGQAQDHILVEGLDIPQISLGGLGFMNNYSFVPWPQYGILGTLQLLSELARALEAHKYEKEGWKALSFIR